MGGLRAGNTEPMPAGPGLHPRRLDAVSARPPASRSTWRSSTASFIYDTEPACRAVVTVRRLAPEHGAALHGARQQAFYAENRDMTSAEEIAEVAEEAGFDAAEFGGAFARPRRRTRRSAIS